MQYFGYGTPDLLVGGYGQIWFVAQEGTEAGREYEEAEALAQLRRGSRAVRYGCYLLQKDLIRVGRVEMMQMRIDCEEGSGIPMSMSGEMRMEEAMGLDFAAIKLQPVMAVQMADGGFYEWALGVFLPITPRPRYTGTGGHYELSCYDMTMMLRDDRLLSTLAIPAGTPYMEAITTLIMQAGIKFIIADRTDAQLPQEIQFEIGTARLDAANTLLRAINYEPVWADERGYIQLRAQVGPYSRAVKHRYLDDEMSVLAAEMGEDMDSYEVPNIIIGVVSRPEGAPLRAEWRNEDPGSALSIERRGRKVVRVDTLDDILDEAALDAYVRAEGYKTLARNGRVSFSTLNMPGHGVRDMIYLANSRAGIGGRYMETGWTMELRAGGIMSHTAQRVVIV